MPQAPDIDIGNVGRWTFWFLWAGGLAWLALFGLMRLHYAQRGHRATTEAKEATTRIHKAEAGKVEVELAERQAKFARTTPTTTASGAIPPDVLRRYVVADHMMTIVVGWGTGGLKPYRTGGWSVTGLIAALARKYKDGSPVRGGSFWNDADEAVTFWCKRADDWRDAWEQGQPVKPLKPGD